MTASPGELWESQRKFKGYEKPVRQDVNNYKDLPTVRNMTAVSISHTYWQVKP